MKTIIGIHMAIIISCFAIPQPSQIIKSEYKKEIIKVEPIVTVIKTTQPIVVARQEIPRERAKPLTNKEQIKQIIIKWADYYGVSRTQLLRVANCESGYNPKVVNHNYYDHGHPTGLFQHISGYWPGRAKTYGVPGASIFDPEAQAKVTAGMFRDGQSNLWECK